VEALHPAAGGDGADTTVTTEQVAGTGGRHE
ncbi:MAG: hypothetical protein JWM85_740, partial [Acidimicrobiaceae bacterium]|nr:hypothetical protein [Acidimicrobiaceae bacterium]